MLFLLQGSIHEESAETFKPLQLLGLLLELEREQVAVDSLWRAFAFPVPFILSCAVAGTQVDEGMRSASKRIVAPPGGRSNITSLS